MAQVEFKYTGISIVIKFKENEIMKNIIEEFVQKARIVKKNNIYFLYDWKADIKTKENLPFLEVLIQWIKIKKR